MADGRYGADKVWWSEMEWNVWGAPNVLYEFAISCLLGIQLTRYMPCWLNVCDIPLLGVLNNVFIK